MGIGIASVVNLLDPAVVVVGGGLGSADGPYWTGRCSRHARRVLGLAQDVPIVHAQLGASAGAIGADRSASDTHVKVVNHDTRQPTEVALIGMGNVASAYLRTLDELVVRGGPAVV